MEYYHLPDAHYNISISDDIDFYPMGNKFLQLLTGYLPLSQHEAIFKFSLESFHACFHSRNMSANNRIIIILRKLQQNFTVMYQYTTPLCIKIQSHHFKIKYPLSCFKSLFEIQYHYTLLYPQIESNQSRLIKRMPKARINIGFRHFNPLFPLAP